MLLRELKPLIVDDYNVIVLHDYKNGIRMAEPVVKIDDFLDNEVANVEAVEDIVNIFVKEEKGRLLPKETTDNETIQNFMVMMVDRFCIKHTKCEECPLGVKDFSGLTKCMIIKLRNVIKENEKTDT